MKNLENSIKEILFNIGKEIKVHKLIDGNLILDIDYDKYCNEIINIFNKYLEESNLKDVW
jgi:hypothetical protein